MAKATPTGDKPVKTTKAVSEKPAKTKPVAATKTVKTTASSQKPVTGKAPAVKRAPAAKKAAPKITAASPANPVPQLSAEQRRYYVEIAAYYIAERRGFSGGSEFEDWVQAESEIDRLLREGILKP